MKREEVFKILKKYYKNQCYLNLELANLGPVDNINFIKKNVYGVVEHDITLDYLLEKNEFTPSNLELEVLGKMAIYEIKYLNSTDKAIVVNEIINIAKKYVKSGKNYLNNFFRNLDYSNLEIDPMYQKESKNLSIKYSLSQWIIKKLYKQYPDEYLKIIKDMQQEKKLFITNLSANSLSKNFRKIKNDCFEYLGEDILAEQEYENGEIIIQDYGSNQIINNFTNISDETVIDLCAAPGAKSLLMAKRAEKVLATDLYSHRVKLIEKNIIKTGFTNIITNTLDATNIEQIKKVINEANIKSINYILLDVPCSGWGVIKSKPEIRYSRSEEVEKLKRIQMQILENAAQILDKKGQIMYSTCTLNKEENEEQIKKFLLENKDFRLIKEETIYPYEHNNGGFYFSILEKNE